MCASWRDPTVVADTYPPPAAVRRLRLRRSYSDSNLALLLHDKNTVGWGIDGTESDALPWFSIPAETQCTLFIAG